MIAGDIFTRAVALIGSFNEDGGIDEDSTALYKSLAPDIIDQTQKELAFLEGITAEPVLTLEDAITISDDSAGRIMPYGVAMRFVLAEANAMLFNQFELEYQAAKRTVRHEDEAITDKYDVLAGMG